MTQRRLPSGQGPARRPSAARRSPTSGARATTGTKARTRNTGPVRAPSSRRTPGNDGGEAAKRTDAPRPRALTGRATILIAVIVALALAYTYPLRTYLDQETQIAQMEQSQAKQRETIADTAKELEKWQDDEYLRIQAREKYFYVRPGETPLLVYPDPEGAARDADEKAPAAAPDRWYDTLWSSVQAANAEPAN
ncbi:putative septum formation initiator [Actinoplanes missouriensis 431]|uniref:Putative septum formation initiator n=1 Tax=Actinoplanes missouriensis (strain ATCC 14538 / DSM 43046 / CBS 188.64 / JCM 3121 / NBRC 102363 / NCIMB 12654 / NRRL B-3342 / UNCC 431) TaxID=512565 RepID=I0GYZ1_ACTM4|nr:septum formation initiator family protein [Actinoplanes missouriensis]BAL85978.1 putative septum formation initiator [Actinoplanes missouriensis 431]